MPQSPLPPIDTPHDVTPDLNDDPIVAGLRTLYREVLLEPVPDDFSDLLAQIDAALEAAPDAAEIEPSS